MAIRATPSAVMASAVVNNPCPWGCGGTMRVRGDLLECSATPEHHYRDLRPEEFILKKPRKNVSKSQEQTEGDQAN